MYAKPTILLPLITHHTQDGLLMAAEGDITFVFKSETNEQQQQQDRPSADWKFHIKNHMQQSIIHLKHKFTTED